jgi:hypothetical protein
VFRPGAEQKVNHPANRAFNWRTDVEVTAMADAHNGNPAVRSGGRSATLARTRAGNTSRANERLIEQLRQLDREVIHEPVPQHLIDIVRAKKARRRLKQPSSGHDTGEP